MITKEKLLETIKVKPLVINTCSMCGYECSFYFKGDMLGYDSGCYCTNMSGGWTPRKEAEIDFYLEPSHGWLPQLEEFVRK